MGLIAHVREQMTSLRRNEDRWRGGGQAVTRNGRRVVLFPDCEHRWEYVGGNVWAATVACSQCRLCGGTQVTFTVVDLDPDEWVEIGVRFR